MKNNTVADDAIVVDADPGVEPAVAPDAYVVAQYAAGLDQAAFAYLGVGADRYESSDRCAGGYAGRGMDGGRWMDPRDYRRWRVEQRRDARRSRRRDPCTDDA